MLLRTGKSARRGYHAGNARVYMDWRESFLRRFGPGLLGGITLSQWIKLLRRYGLNIDGSRLPRACAITAQSLKNSLLQIVERYRYESRIRDIVVQPPLFVLGHWRSGTTHLHESLAQDPRFASPNLFQVSFPHTFLCSEATDAKIVAFFLPRHRPMDNMEWGPGSPQEDEFALLAATFMSPCMAWVFPRQRDQFKRYLTFQEVEPGEVAQWEAAFVRFLKKLQWRYQRPMILKSPPHTARIRLLLELFPKAKFVHIHRNPYRVFQSSQHTLRIMLDWQALQRSCPEVVDDWIIAQYKDMYESFLRERPSIPAGSYYEVSFEELNRNPLEEVRKLYRGLDLPDFAEVEARLRTYIGSLAGYKKNSFEELSSELKARLAHEWRACFEAWGYPTGL